MAPPEKEPANEAVVAILAARLALHGDEIRIVAGHSSPTKEVAITGLDDDGGRKRLP